MTMKDLKFHLAILAVFTVYYLLTIYLVKWIDSLGLPIVAEFILAFLCGLVYYAFVGIVIYEIHDKWTRE